ncbi:hypothetical protein DPMN_062832 [Dreissena polymorpha]|uniref:Uncharacterized protein n=1 Tax=Dreissena polymorpha TaxID=45954 RepID=A0A9D4CA55_DREPO|nr:hypothetical protein DPMN_062832 [Dreissena polymorpha]
MLAYAFALNLGTLSLSSNADKAATTFELIAFAVDTVDIQLQDPGWYMDSAPYVSWSSESCNHTFRWVMIILPSSCRYSSSLISLTG